jgi:hypothetical protein
MTLDEMNLTDEQLAQVTKYVQSETDKVRTDYSQKLKTVNEELSKYKPAEKSASELALEEKMKVLEEKEKELSKRENYINLENKLTAKGLPKELAQYLNIGENEDEVLTKIGELVLSNGNVPSNHSKSTGVSKDEFKKMNYIERAKLFQSNPELYKALSK